MHIVESDFVVVPKCAAFPFEDFTRANELYAIGRDATDESIDDLTKGSIWGGKHLGTPTKLKQVSDWAK